MADAKVAPEKHAPPTEIPYGAQTQKTIGKAKRTPDDQAEYFYSIRKSHIVFFVSSFLLLGSLLLTFYDDHWGFTRQANRDWKEYQRVYAGLDFALLQSQIAEIETQLSGASGEISQLEKARERLQAALENPETKVAPTIRVLEERIDDVANEAKQRGWTLTRGETTTDEKARRVVPVALAGVSPVAVRKLKDSISSEHYDKQMQMNFANGDKLVVRWRYEEAEHHLREARASGHDVAKAEEHYRHEKAEWDKIVETARANKEAFDAIDWRMSLYDDILFSAQAPLAEKNAQLARRRKEYEDKLRRYQSEKPQIANTIRNAPMMDFFDPTLKIQQVVLDGIREDFHFAKIERVERCHTCHKGISNPAFAADVDPKAKLEVDRYKFRDPLLRSLVDYARGAPGGEMVEKLVADGKLSLEIKKGSWKDDDAIKYVKTLMAHPRLDLYVSGASPHALERVGCTSCHEGDGRDTEFSRAVHMPSDEAQKKGWERRHGYHYRELWDRPMLPKKHVYAGCRKCHREQVELPFSEDYQRGMLLYERAGCYACHRTDTYQVLPKDTSDPKMDPNRKMRRPGPPLTHVADKLTPEFALGWVLSPKSFRRTTKMPHFFGQSNARTVSVSEKLAGDLASAGTGQRVPAGGATYGPEAVESAQASAMVRYLFSTSQTRSYPELPKLRGDAKRGEAAFEQIGCRACHVTTPDEKYERRVEGVLNADDVFRAPDGKSWYLDEFAPNLAGTGTKLGAGTPAEDRGRRWLYQWLQNPEHYFAQTRMPKMRPQDKPEMEPQETLDLVEYLMSLRKTDWSAPAVATPPPGLMDYLVFEQLRLKMPDVDAVDELGLMKRTPEAMTLWYGRKMVQNFGCYSCHEMKPEVRDDLARLNSRIENEVDWTNAEGIGVELTGAQPEGVKAVDRLDFGYTAEDHLGNHKGVSFTHGYTGKPYKHVDPSNSKPDTVRVPHHYRHAWIFNKLLDPRVFDGGKLSSKPPDELLRMPNFYFTPEEARLVTTFVLSFTDHDIPNGLVEGVKKRFTSDEAALNRGEKLIRENNCRACHRFQLDRFEVEHRRMVKRGEKEKETTTFVWVEGKVKAELPRSDVDPSFRAWGLAATPQSKLYSIEWATDSRTLRHEPGDAPDGSVKDTPVIRADLGRSPFVAFDGRDLWLVDGQLGQPMAEGRAPTRIRSHVPQLGGDIVPQIVAYKTAHAEAFGIDTRNAGSFENRIPPMLRTQGAKTRPDWLFAFLKRPHVVRPALLLGRGVPPQYGDFNEAIQTAYDEVDDDNLDEPLAAFETAAAALPNDPVKETVQKIVAGYKAGTKGRKPLEAAILKAQEAIKVAELNVRMPTFGFTDEETTALVRYFWVRDQLPGGEAFPYEHPWERDPAEVAERAELIRTSLEKDVRPVCMQCHYVDGRPPAIPEVTKTGPELNNVPARFRPRWLHAWMKSAKDIYPGTTMIDHNFDNDPKRREANVVWMLNDGKLGAPK